MLYVSCFVHVYSLIFFLICDLFLILAVAAYFFNAEEHYPLRGMGFQFSTLDEVFMQLPVYVLPDFSSLFFLSVFMLDLWLFYT